MTTRTVALALLALAVLAGCDRDASDAGPVRAETREVTTFNSVEMSGSARVEITLGTPESVTISGVDAALKRVETSMRGDTLYIRVKRGRDWWDSGVRPALTIRITAPKLESLELKGGNDVRLVGYDGGESRIKVEGATHLKADGRLDRLTVFMAGAGHADFSKLVAANAKVTVAGVGSVFVHPSETLDATMNGVGAILYSGSPREVNTHMNGIGTIGRGEPRDDDDEDDATADDKKPVDPDSLKPEYDPKDQQLEKIRDLKPTEVI